MNHARRMVIVPEETLSRLRISVPTATAVSASTGDSTTANVTHDSMQTVGGEASSRLDSEMFELMNSKDITDEREKCVKYLQILRRYLYFKDKERHSEFMSRLDGDDESDASAIARLTEDRIIENLPVAHAEHARSLLRHWLSFEPDRFKWNDKGNVIIDGTVVPQSNIVELLAHVVKKSGRTNKPPVGQLEFAKFIGTSATPVNLIGNLDILETAKRLSEPMRKPSKRRRHQQQQQPGTSPTPQPSAKFRLVENVQSSTPGQRLTRNGTRKRWLNYKI
ncbi:hypothetical protein QAD02_000962 [Eretmocerus hayati]|uniref:Uncharacterized protein n=1 Tax=Eretmocerus hayati TaxID=131215 RepID=A0ACC2NFJ7_9HYME|nr:hypothetical protein QAD02_000962 [Eretmocerus hayati]